MGTTIREMEELLLPVNSLFANAHLSPYSNLPPCLFLPVSFFGCIHFLKYFFHSSNFSNVFESTACFFLLFRHYSSSS